MKDVIEKLGAAEELLTRAEERAKEFRAVVNAGGTVLPEDGRIAIERGDEVRELFVTASRDGLSYVEPRIGLRFHLTREEALASLREWLA